MGSPVNRGKFTDKMTEELYKKHTVREIDEPWYYIVKQNEELSTDLLAETFADQLTISTIYDWTNMSHISEILNSK